ncbi:hypothetical protein Slin15195_G019390 [Septoria linicola]|uniref:Uncharacterized protein n=1 Tax=Septoria linicola TaxID=215465 RepID=A0A9Q9AGF6_9PEZI|nr:hypothetical protein Slin14017_G019450 [Septoria linicola]USW48620.1 hypothetical protein Slin15195_G019390 [Septoria linicola]
MGKAFFMGWATWEKLVFILACAIVVTVLLGCAKLIWTHQKLRKYSGGAENDRKEQAVYRQMSQRRNAQGGAEVPFGIRAIESGIEVEGVWISRSNTPEPVSSARTSASSVRDEGRGQVLERELEQRSAKAPHARSRSNSSTGIATKFTEMGREESVKAAGGRHHPPLSYARYSGNPALTQSNSVATTTTSTKNGRHGPDSADEQSTLWTPGWDSCSSRSGSEVNVADLTSSSAPQIQGPQGRQRQQSAELELMHTHRMSQAAETGQLTPRVRVPRQGVSGDWAGLPSAQRSSTASDLGNYQRARARSQSPIARPATATGSRSTNLNRPPSIDSLSAAARRSSLPDVTPFAQFCRTAPTLSQSESRQSSPGTTTRSAMEQVSDSLTEYMNASSSVEAHNPTTAAGSQNSSPGAADTQAERVLVDRRGSEILRGHGSGFEILRPGTLSEAAERQRSVPPVSLYNNASRPRSESDGSRRKLQKKRRPSADSQGSSSGSRWSRGSML